LTVNPQIPKYFYLALSR